MAISHDDLSIKSRSSSSSKLALLLVLLSILCSLSGFLLCLAAEASRSEASWFIRTSPDDNGEVYECVYSSSGRTPLACAVAAFLALAAAMFAQHAYLLVVVTRPPVILAWTHPAADHHPASSYRTLTWQACFLFLATWICFAVAEVLLMIGIGGESGHLSRWKRLRSSCTIIRPGIFAAAGVLGLTTIFLGVGLFLTASRMQRLHQEEEESMHRRGASTNESRTHRNLAAMGTNQSQPSGDDQSLWKTSTTDFFVSIIQDNPGP